MGGDKEIAIKEAEQINWTLMAKSELVKKILGSDQIEMLVKSIIY